MQSGKGKLPSSSGKKGKEPAKRTPKKHDRIDSDSDDGSSQLSKDSDRKSSKDGKRKSSTSKEHTRKSAKELFPDKSPYVSESGFFFDNIPILISITFRY